MVKNNMVVSFHYTLKNDKAELLDTSEGQEPLTYIHGMGHIIPGLESAMEGKNEGDSFSITIAPADGYGEFSEELIFEVPKDQLSNLPEIKEGMQVQTETEEGIEVLTIKSIQDEMVTLDANHPLAGETLNFDISIVEVRNATEEEISHGHLHDDHECCCCEDEEQTEE